MNFLAIIPLVITILYLTIYFWRIHTIPESISETSYLWSPGYFTAYCFALGFSLFIPWIFFTPQHYGFLCFLGVSGIFAAGSSPFFKEKFEAKIHYTGGIVAMLMWIVWMCLQSYYIPLVVFLGISALLSILIKWNSMVFWGEVVGIATLCTLLLLK